VYGLFHAFVYTSTNNTWHLFIAPFLIGLFMSAVRAYTRSTRAAIVAHVGFGLFALLKLLAVPV
jgi:MFS-type transporter involved in bile tolerance (Atg22 family)